MHKQIPVACDTRYRRKYFVGARLAAYFHTQRLGEVVFLVKKWGEYGGGSVPRWQQSTKHYYQYFAREHPVCGTSRQMVIMLPTNAKVGSSVTCGDCHHHHLPPTPRLPSLRKSICA